jgi:hypothetical protein
LDVGVVATGDQRTDESEHQHRSSKIHGRVTGRAPAAETARAAIGRTRPRVPLRSVRAVPRSGDGTPRPGQPSTVAKIVDELHLCHCHAPVTPLTVSRSVGAFSHCRSDDPEDAADSGHTVAADRDPDQVQREGRGPSRRGNTS